MRTEYVRKRNETVSATVFPHAPTVGLSAVLVSAVLGVLLLLTWFQERNHRALLWWAPLYFALAVGAGLVALRGHVSNFLSIEIGNALLIVAAGLAWAGARCFEGRSVRWWWLAAPAAGWIALCQLPIMAADLRLRITVISIIFAVLLALSAREFWRGRAETLMSRWPAIILFVAYGAMMLARIPPAYFIALPPQEQLFEVNWFGIVALGTLVFVVALAFVLLALTKERSELLHRTAALVDPLTGLANRRAFLDDGSANIGFAARTRQPAAVLVFDLDRFKQINDRYGHPVGDRVLQVFAQAARAQIRSSDIVGRIGGEEFAAVLLDCSRSQALDVAERIRASFADKADVVDSLRLNATVSVGVAVLEPGQEFHALLAVADQAVYRAKSDGRNCVRALEEEGEGAPSPHRPGRTGTDALAA